ncbi:MAG: TRAP transporter substrate-binding protein [Pseudomonadota bacterium]
MTDHAIRRGGLAALALAGLLSAPAAAQEVTLSMHHFLGPNAPTHKSFMVPWAERVEAASGGRIDIEIFPAMSLGGKPPELYSQVRDGVADIVWTLPGYTPGVFPRVEVFELPGVHLNSAEVTNQAIQEIWPMLAADFEDVKPILVHVHAGNALHLIDAAVAGPEDIADLKLRTPSRTGAWLIEAWGAEPVGMPVPALPQALARGVVAGALVPFEIIAPLKLHELTGVSVEGPDGARCGTAVFRCAMNRGRYEALPDDLKQVIDDHSGIAIATEAGVLWDGFEAPGYRLQRESGGEVVTLSPEAMAAFDARSAPVVDRWVEGSADQGFDGAALVEAARAAMQKHAE